VGKVTSGRLELALASAARAEAAHARLVDSVIPAENAAEILATLARLDRDARPAMVERLLAVRGTSVGDVELNLRVAVFRHLDALVDGLMLLAGDVPPQRDPITGDEIVVPPVKPRRARARK
jgi:hypothetical protein